MNSDLSMTLSRLMDPLILLKCSNRFKISSCVKCVDLDSSIKSAWPSLLTGAITIESMQDTPHRPPETICPYFFLLFFLFCSALSRNRYSLGLKLARPQAL
eukprot:31687_6